MAYARHGLRRATCMRHTLNHYSHQVPPSAGNSLPSRLFSAFPVNTTKPLPKCQLGAYACISCSTVQRTQISAPLPCSCTLLAQRTARAYTHAQLHSYLQSQRHHHLDQYSLACQVNHERQPACPSSHTALLPPPPLPRTPPTCRTRVPMHWTVPPREPMLPCTALSLPRRPQAPCTPARHLPPPPTPSHHNLKPSSS